MNRCLCLRKYYVLNAFYCILGAPTSRFGGGQPPSAGPDFNHRNFLDLVLDLNYFSFSHHNPNLTRHTYLNKNPYTLIISSLSLFEM